MHFHLVDQLTQKSFHLCAAQKPKQPMHHVMNRNHVTPNRRPLLLRLCWKTRNKNTNLNIELRWRDKDTSVWHLRVVIFRWNFPHLSTLVHLIFNDLNKASSLRVVVCIGAITGGRTISTTNVTRWQFNNYKQKDKAPENVKVRRLE